MNGYIDDQNRLVYDGRCFPLTPSQATIMELLLTGRVARTEVIEDALWPLDCDREMVNPWATIKVHIHQLRNRMPLKIRNVYNVGYVLDLPMTEDKPRPPEVDQALGRVKQDFEEGALRDLDLKPGPRTYEGNTGNIKAENDKIEVEVIVKPKEQS